MKVYKVPKIEKPFSEPDPAGRYRAGDVGIYDYHVLSAKKQGAILKVQTPKGTTYVKPETVLQENRHIFRQMDRERPMRLYILTPEYGNRQEFFKDGPEQTWDGVRQNFEALRVALKEGLKIL